MLHDQIQSHLVVLKVLCTHLTGATGQHQTNPTTNDVLNVEKVSDNNNNYKEHILVMWYSYNDKSDKW